MQINSKQPQLTGRTPTECQNVSEERIEYHIRVVVAPPSQAVNLREHATARRPVCSSKPYI